MRGYRSPANLRRLGVALTASIAIAGVVVPSSGAAAAAPKRVISARTSTPLPLPAPGMVTVQTIKLSGGAWSVIAKATVANPSATDFVRCQIYDKTNHVGLDGATSQLGSAIAQSGSITNMATVVVPSETTVQLQQRCGHDGTSGNASSVAADASIVAFLTLDGNAPGQSLARTSTTTPVSSTDTTVLTLPLDQGTYAIGFNTTAVTFSGDARVFCHMNVPRGYGGGTTVDIGGTTAVATDAFFNYVSTFNTVSISVSLVCWSSGAAGAYLDPDAVLWARRVHSFTAVEGGCNAALINATSDLVAVVRPFTVCTIASTPTPMSQAYVGKGTWVVVGGESDVVNNSGPADSVSCEVSTVGSGHLDGTATWEQFSHDVGLTLLGTVKLTAPTTFQEFCHRDHSPDTSASLAGSIVLIRV